MVFFRFFEGCGDTRITGKRNRLPKEKTRMFRRYFHIPRKKKSRNRRAAAAKKPRVPWYEANNSVYLQKTTDDMDRKTLEFTTYCISKLSQVLKLPQREVYRRLKDSGILYDYIVPSYDVLHTFGSRYLMDDLIEYMKEKGVLEE